MDYLEQPDRKNFNTSKRGAYIYRFQPDRYEAAVAENRPFYLKP